MPAGYEDLATLLPAKAVVCAPREDSKSVFLQFASSDVKSMWLETMLKLRQANWVLSKEGRATDSAVSLTASNNNRELSFTINRQNGGPYQGRITGNLFIQNR